MNPGHTHTPAELKAKYLYMFPDESLGFSIAHGWIDLFAQLCADIEALLGEEKLRFHWIQVKEKFGSARFYWQFGKYEPLLTIDIFGEDEIVSIRVPSVRRRKHAKDDELHMKRIDELVKSATRKTREMCVVCGEPGKLDSSGGYLLVLCPEHAQQRMDGALDGFWFDPDE